MSMNNKLLVQWIWFSIYFFTFRASKRQCLSYEPVVRLFANGFCGPGQWGCRLNGRSRMVWQPVFPPSPAEPDNHCMISPEPGLRNSCFKTDLNENVMNPGFFSWHVVQLNTRLSWDIQMYWVIFIEDIIKL